MTLLDSKLHQADARKIDFQEVGEATDSRTDTFANWIALLVVVCTLILMGIIM